MNHEILYAPDNTLVKVVLNKGEAIRTESDAMVAMSDGINLKTGFGAGKNSGGILKNVLRGLLTSESFFTNVFTATADAQEILLAPGLEGDIEWVELNNTTLIIQAGSFLGCTPDLNVDTQFQGFKSFFSGESMFMLKVSGNGFVIINAFGGIEKITVEDSFIVDTGHIVAFTEGLNYKVGKAGDGWINSFLSGEGLICEFTGKGSVYVQSRNPVEYGREIGGMLKPIIKNE